MASATEDVGVVVLDGIVCIVPLIARVRTSPPPGLSSDMTSLIWNPSIRAQERGKALLGILGLDSTNGVRDLNRRLGSSQPLRKAL